MRGGFVRGWCGGLMMLKLLLLYGLFECWKGGRREEGGGRGRNRGLRNCLRCFAWDDVLLGEEGREGRWKSGNGRTLEANKYIDVQ
jgi:hypothetical protein